MGDVADAGEALIENNEVHGNSPDAVRGGISVRDAQNATIQNNRFGAVTIAGVAYPPNSSKVATIASDSGRTDRPDLLNIDIVNNTLNGETIKGCELPDTVVECSEAQSPPSTDTTPPTTVLSTSPIANATRISPTANVTAFFSEEMMASSIDATTFQLTKKGSTTKIGAVVQYFPDDPATTDTVEARATLDPTNSQQMGVTYKAVVTTGAKDSVGNALAQQYRWFFTVS